MKLKKIYLLIVAIIVLPIGVHAAPSYSLTAPSSVENGGSVTAKLTLKQTASWNVKIISAGSTSGCSGSFADATSNGKNATKTLSVTCKATSLGVISFTVTGDITSEDGTNTNVSTTKRITVVPPREKSNDATLSSLSVEGYTLSPEFNKDTLEYTVNAPSTIEKIKIDAKVNESHATLIGTGEFEVTEGMNTFKIVVTSETGQEKTYVVNVNVEDQNPIEITIDGKNYTIIKNEKSLQEPNLFEKTTVKIKEFDIPAFYNDVANMTLIGLKDDTGNIKLAIYKNDTYIIYNEYKNANLNIYLIDFDKPIENYIKGTVTINNIKIPTYQKKENSRYVIVNGLNLETGEYNYYSYDTKEETFQIWNQEELESLEKDIKTYFYACVIFGGGLIFAFLLILCLLGSRRKLKKFQKQIENKKQKSKKEGKTIKLEKLTASMNEKKETNDKN